MEDLNDKLKRGGGEKTPEQLAVEAEKARKFLNELSDAEVIALAQKAKVEQGVGQIEAQKPVFEPGEKEKHEKEKQAKIAQLKALYDNGGKLKVNKTLDKIHQKIAEDTAKLEEDFDGGGDKIDTEDPKQGIIEVLQTALDQWGNEMTDQEKQKINNLIDFVNDDNLRKSNAKDFIKRVETLMQELQENFGDSAGVEIKDNTDTGGDGDNETKSQLQEEKNEPVDEIVDDNQKPNEELDEEAKKIQMDARIEGKDLLIQQFQKHGEEFYNIIRKFCNTSPNVDTNSILNTKMLQQENGDVEENMKREGYTDGFLGFCIIAIEQGKKQNILDDKGVKTMITAIKKLAEKTKFYNFEESKGNGIILDALTKLEQGNLEDADMDIVAKNIGVGKLEEPTDNNAQPLKEILQVQQMDLSKAKNIINHTQQTTNSIKKLLKTNRGFDDRNLQQSIQLFLSAEKERKKTLPKEKVLGLITTHIAGYITSYDHHLRKEYIIDPNIVETIGQIAQFIGKNTRNKSTKDQLKKITNWVRGTLQKHKQHINHHII